MRNPGNPRTQARKIALAGGEKHYFSGTKCKNGNVAKRITSCGRCMCVACNKEHAGQVGTAFHRKNPESPILGETPRAMAAAAGVKRYANGKACKHGNVADRLVSNGACLCSDCERSRRESNPALRSAVMRNWRSGNPDRVREYKAARRRACSRVAWADQDAIKAVYAEARRLERSDGIKRHVDHELPLYGELVSGLHVHQNLQILPARANLKKGNTFTVEA